MAVGSKYAACVPIVLVRNNNYWYGEEGFSFRVKRNLNVSIFFVAILNGKSLMWCTVCVLYRAAVHVHDHSLYAKYNTYIYYRRILEILISFVIVYSKEICDDYTKIRVLIICIVYVAHGNIILTIFTRIICRVSISHVDASLKKKCIHLNLFWNRTEHDVHTYTVCMFSFELSIRRSRRLPRGLHSFQQSVWHRKTIIYKYIIKSIIAHTTMIILYLESLLCVPRRH